MINLYRLFRDLFILTISYFLGFWLRFGYPFPEKNYTDFIRILPFTLLAFILISLTIDNYPNINLPASEEIAGFAAASLVTTIIWSTFNYFLNAFALPRTILLIALIIQIVILPIILYIERKFRLTWKKTRIGIIGDDTIAYIIGNKIKTYSNIENVDSIVLTTRNQEDITLLLRAIEKGKHVLIKPELIDTIVSASKFISFANHPMISYSAPVISPTEIIIKRIIDVSIGFIGSIITLILLPFIGLAIYIDSPGPIFFLQTRLGKNGKHFKVIKFRTMILDAEKHTGAVLAQENDPRITGVGKFLRKTRLDELPQFFNVLLGQMSIVGPRPERPEIYKKILPQIPIFKIRLMVKPGITGLAQVYGKYDTSPEEKLTYDLMYILTKPKIPQDIRIILMTIKIMLIPEKAR